MASDASCLEGTNTTSARVLAQNLRADQNVPPRFIFRGTAMFPERLGIVLFIAAALTAAAGDKSQRVSFATLPAAVQRAVQAQLGKGKVGEIEKYTEDSVVTY